MNLTERIKAENNRVGGEITRLQHDNKIDFEILEELKKNYHASILTADDIEIDKVNFQIKEVSARITRRNEKIDALGSKNNPIIQNMISEEIQKWQNEKAILEEQAATLYIELDPKHKELIDKIREMVHMKYRVDTLNSAIGSYGQELNEDTRKSLNINLHRYNNPILDKILALLIEHREVFKRVN